MADVSINLDIDLRRKLKARLEQDGVSWVLLPTKIQMEYLMPFIKEQKQRELPLMRACGA